MASASRCGRPTSLRQGDQDSSQQSRRQVCLAARRPPDRDEHRVDGTLFGRPAPDAHLHRLADPVVVGRSRDDHDPEVGPSVAQPAAQRQPVLSTEVQVKGHDVDLVMGAQVQSLRG